jgi:hypothetical protein
MSDIAPRSHFETVPADHLPPGQLIDVTTAPGKVIVRLAEGHHTPELRDQLQRFHDIIFEEGRWLQRVPDGASHPQAHKANQDEDDDQEPPVGRYEIVPPGVLPKGYVCYPVETRGEFIWQVIEGHMTTGLRDQFNAWLRQVLGGGDWIQNN